VTVTGVVDDHGSFSTHILNAPLVSQ
jgi:hypothetical protein